MWRVVAIEVKLSPLGRKAKIPLEIARTISRVL
jgi:hypothetical protein